MRWRKSKQRCSREDGNSKNRQIPLGYPGIQDTLGSDRSVQWRQSEVIEVRKGSALFSYKVVALLENRVGAQLVPDYADNLTPESEIQKLRAPVETFFVHRERGTGRPTKKERRTIDALWDSMEED